MSVHIIIPSYNPDASLTKATEAALGQTHQDVLVTVVDDCSDQPVWPRISHLADDQRLRYIRLVQNGGPSIARNIGLLLSRRADYISFHDDDDVPMPNKIERQYTALQQHRSIDELRRQTIDKDGKDHFDIAVSRVIRKEVDGTVQESGSMIYLLRDIYPNAYSHFGTAGRKHSLHVVSSLFQKTSFQQLGGLYPGLFHYEDNELISRLILGGAAINFVEEPLYHFNKSSESLTYRDDDSSEQTRRVFQRIAAMKTDSSRLASSDFAKTYRVLIDVTTGIEQAHNLTVDDIDYTIPASSGTREMLESI